MREIIFVSISLAFSISFSASQLTSNKLCLDSNNYIRDACQQVSRDQELICETVDSKTDCIVKTDLGLPVLTVLDAEEAFLGAGLVSQNPTVIGEIVSDNSPYKTVIIVRSDHIGGFEPLRGLKYCHPGYNHDDRLTRYVLEELDHKIIKYSCNSSKTLTEQKFESLSLTFGSSCRPGRWTQDDILDSKLKSEYGSLCELCGVNGCNTKYIAPLNDTLTCLTSNNGDIALTALIYAETFFSIGQNAQNFKYLCPNGTTASSINPCTWTNQLPRLILTSSPSAHLMTNYIRNKLPSYVNSDGSSSASNIEVYLQKLLPLNQNDRINLISPTPLASYVSERRTIPQVNSSIQCGLTLNWSVTNDLEFNKCKWLQQASLNDGLQPVLSCVELTKTSDYNDTISNLDNIKNGKADIAFADANFGYFAKLKKLVNAAYLETDTAELSKIIMVVKNDTTFSGFKSLQGKGICLPEYGGKEWLAFIDLLREQNILTNSCDNPSDYPQLFNNFVGYSCTPGARSKEMGFILDDSVQSKLCSKCLPLSDVETASLCDANARNKYYDSLGALTCIADGNGDYAVIALNDLPAEYLANTEQHQQFRVVNRNGTLASYTGFNVDENSPISIIIAGELLVQNNTSKYNDIVLYLRELEYEFGLNLQKSFKVFERFNDTDDLLLPESTLGLTFGETSNKYIDNYRALLQNSDKCDSTPSSASYVTNIPPMLVIIATFLYVNFI